MVAVKGRYDGRTVVLDSMPPINECDVIVTFLGPPVPDSTEGSGKIEDDGSLKFLFRDYFDDGIREPVVDFGKAVGKEKW